jgi:adenylate kinase family enzyme
MASSIGGKIVVLGVSASGKSTFARKLGVKTGLPVTYIDSLMWKPGWQYIGDEETVRLIKEASERESWIIEGYIEKEARVNLFNNADTILYLDYPGWLSAWRYIKRWWQHRKKPRPELPGCPEKFSFEFLLRVYKKKEVYRLEKLFKEHDWNSKIIRFKSPKEAERFLKNLQK